MPKTFASFAVISALLLQMQAAIAQTPPNPVQPVPAAQPAPPAVAPTISAPEVPCSNGLPAGDLTAWNGVAAANTYQFALVIGNDYQADGGALDVPPLNNPHNDAQEIGNILRDKGYAVACLWNLDGAGILQAVDRFSAKWEDLANANLTPHGLIYFAGHGGEDGDGNAFVVPEKYRNTNDTIVVVKLRDIVALLPNGDTTMGQAPIIILDACRTADALQGRTIGRQVANNIIGSQTSNAIFGPSVSVKLQRSFSGSAINQFTTTDGTDKRFTIVFSTSANHPAGDGEPGQNGPFVAAINEEFRKQPWDRFVHPELGIFVKDIASDLQAKQIQQQPGGPNSIGAFVPPFIWNVPNGDWSKNGTLWHVGLDDGYFQSQPSSTACTLAEADEARLQGMSARPDYKEWAAAASAELHKMRSVAVCNSLSSEADMAAMVAPEATIAMADQQMAPPPPSPPPPPPPSPVESDTPPVAAMSMMTQEVQAAASKPAMAVNFAPPKAKVTGKARLDSGIATAIANRTTGIPVDLRDVMTQVRLTPTGGTGSVTIGADSFSLDGFKLDCQSSRCSKLRAFISSPSTGQSGFVAADALMHRPADDFVAQFDMIGGAVPPKKLFELETFLEHLSRDTDKIAQISIIDVRKDDGPDFDFGDASRFLEFSQRFVAKYLAISTDRVTVITSLQSDAENRKLCSASAIQGFCFSVQVMPYRANWSPGH